MDLPTKMKKPKDLERINASDIDELLWWSVHLSISPEKLLGIIAESGTAAAVVEQKAKAEKGRLKT